ncbi:MAG: DUF481 domain-containing protein, partial [Pseudomonadota bacterium]
MLLRCLAAALAALLVMPAAAAPMPDAVEAMIRAASPDERDTVVKVAKRSAADSAAEIDTLAGELAAAEAEAAEQRLATNGFFDGWSGEGSLGGTYSTGNTDQTGMAVSLALDKRTRRWEHDIDATFDFLRTDGETQRERYYAAYQGRRDLGDRWFFAFGLLSFERDVFSGIDTRFTESVGAGYRIADSDTFSWTVEGGPALRQTQFIDGTEENRLDALGKTDLDWRISPNFRL